MVETFKKLFTFLNNDPHNTVGASKHRSNNFYLSRISDTCFRVVDLFPFYIGNKIPLKTSYFNK